jgi:hypothetical protein
MGPTDNSPDPRVLLQSIQIAEDRFIIPAICRELYYDFRNQKNVVVTEGNKTDLQAKFSSSDPPVTLAIGSFVNAIEQVTNPAYIELWNEYLWKICAEACVYIASPTNYSKFTASGEMVNNPKSITNEGQGATSVDLKDIKWKLDKLLMDRIDPLIAGAHEWMCINKSALPLYTCKECERERKSDPSGISYKRKTAWIHNIYPEDRHHHYEHENCDDDER